MKKYWKLLSLIILIITTISILYTKYQIEASSNPVFEIKHEHGDQAEVHPLTIYGNYSKNEDFIYPQITAEGTFYQESSSYIAMFKEPWIPSEIKTLQKNHRNFMRGKEYGMYYFFENEDFLIATHVNYDYLYKDGHEREYVFKIDLLKKETNKSTSFTMPISVEGEHNYVDIMDIQVADDQLKIIAAHNLTAETELEDGDEIHQYSIDLNTGQLQSDDVFELPVGKIKEDHWLRISSIKNERIMQPNQYVVYEVAAIHEFEDSVAVIDEFEDSYEEILEQKFVAHDLVTNEQHTINLPEEYENSYPMAVSEHIVYFVQVEKDSIEVIGYNLEHKQIDTLQTFSVPKMEEGLTSKYEIKNDKIYIVHPLKVGKINASIVIGDIQTGEILYEGSTKISEKSQKGKVDEVYIDGISVTKE